MSQAEGSVVIERPRDEVFAFLADGENNGSWRPGVVSVQRMTPGATAAGTAFKQVHKGPMGRTIAADYEITAFEPSTRLAFRVTAGPARPAGEYALSDAGAATKIVFRLSWQPTGLSRLLSGAVARQMRLEIAHLENLKRVLEEQAR